MSILNLFLVFLKINCLAPSGPASIGLIKQEIVGKYVTEQQFQESVAFATALPGSDALQLALYTGYQVHGVIGALACLLGAILPPTLIILCLVYILEHCASKEIVSKFVAGTTPVLATLLIVSGLSFINDNNYFKPILMVILTLLSIHFNISIIFVLLIAGVSAFL